MATKRRTGPKTHYELSRGVGTCGHFGETTKDKAKVTCKFCLKQIASRKYLF